MGLRFRRRLRLAPGLRLNLSRGGVSLSIGHRGAWYTMGPDGRRRATVGLPGTGLSYTTQSGGDRRVADDHAENERAEPPDGSGLLSLGVLLLVVVTIALCALAFYSGLT